MPRYEQTLDPSYTEDPLAPQFGEDNNSASEPGAGSGSVALSYPNVGQIGRASADVKSVVRWTAPDQFARELALLVSVTSILNQPNPNKPFDGESALLAQGDGQGNIANSESGGVLRLTYGFGNALRTVEADLFSGTFAIPACNALEVSAFAYKTTPINVNVSAAVVPGRVQSPARLHNTQRVFALPNDIATIKVPFGARWVALFGGAPTNVGAGQPVATLTQDNYGTFILHDYVNGVFVGAPGVPIELASRRDLVLKNLGAATNTWSVRFYLEL